MIYYANHASILVQTVRESPYFKIHCSLFYKPKFTASRHRHSFIHVLYG